MESIESLAARLQAANYAYHNTDKVLMSDEEYDAALEALRTRCPTHPFLKMIGAPADAKGTVLLPYTMASLDKVRYGEGGQQRFLKRHAGVKEYIVSEKLDGLSALYVCDGKTNKLYLRGDGVKGVDVSFAVGCLALPKTKCVVRGEILLPNASTPAGSIGRSLVNGWLHRAAQKELCSCHFVGYQVLEPKGMTREHQMSWMREVGFRTPTVQLIPAKALTEEVAKEILVTWRAASAYPLDGIVIGTNTIPHGTTGGEATNPDDAVAFKAALDEQRATTTVVAVEWNLSRQGIWVPRIQIEPVVIGGAKIQWLSGHNAAAIAAGGIGPHARIVIRRSGDVIPTLDTVVSPAPGGAAMPADGSWEWDAREVQAIATGDVESAEKAIQHALTVFGVEGIGPGLVKKLVEANLNTIGRILAADPESIATAIGAGRGPAFQKALQAAVQSASQVTCLIASNKLPRGVAEKKLRSLYALVPDARNWADVFALRAPPAGWSKETLDALLQTLPHAFQWISDNLGTEPTPTVCASASASAASAATAATGGAAAASSSKDVKYVVFTGVRDKELQSRMGAKGWEMQDAVTKQTSLVVTADTPVESGKTKKARELGIEICTISKFRERC